jgi:hypothetical protein
MQVGFTAIPFAVLTLGKDRRRAMWATATALMTALWAFFVWQIYQDSLSGFAGGANIGLGLIMISGPVLSLIVLAIVGAILRWRAS